MEPAESNKVVFSNELLSLIRDATIEESAERVKVMLESSDVHAVDDESGYTLLHYSVRSCNRRVVKYLLERGVQVDAQCPLKMTPLMLALQWPKELSDNYFTIIELLLEAGADVEFVHEARKKSILQMVLQTEPRMEVYCYIRMCCVMEALRKKCWSSEVAAQKLIDAGCRLDQAARLRDTRVLELMLERGFPVDSTDPYSKETALHVAARFFVTKSVELLVNHGADVDAVNAEGQTPVGTTMSSFFSAKKRFEKELPAWKILVGLGTKVSSCTNFGNFQIVRALLYGDCGVIRVLLEAQLDFKAKEQSGNDYTMLHYLVINSNANVYEALKPHLEKFDLNAVDSCGRSPLFYAAKIQQDARLVKLFLDNGANADDGIRAYSRFKDMISTPSNDFVKPRSDKCLELLLQYNADPQFVMTRKNGRQITIFEDVKKNKERKIVVEHLAMLKKLDTPLTEITLTKIKSDPSLQKHFDKCLTFLDRIVCGTVTIWQLLTADDKKMAKYSNNQELVLKLNRISRKQKRVRSAYQYYYSTVKKRYTEGILYRKSRDKAEVAICRLLENRFDRFDIAVQKILDYLDNQSLQCLHLLDGTDDSSK